MSPLGFLLVVSTVVASAFAQTPTCLPATIAAAACTCGTTTCQPGDFCDLTTAAGQCLPQCAGGAPEPAPCRCASVNCNLGDTCAAAGANGQGQCTPQCAAGITVQCSCGATAQCQPQEICVPTGNGGQGLCQAPGPQPCPTNGPSPAACSCGTQAQCNPQDTCDTNGNNGQGQCKPQCIPFQQAPDACICVSQNCNQGDSCDPNANNNLGQCAATQQLQQCNQGQVALADCLCGTNTCTQGLVCNNGVCDINVSLKQCPTSSQPFPPAGCICGSEVCTTGQQCQNGQKCTSLQQCPAAQQPAPAECLCGSTTCQKDERCSAQLGTCLPPLAHCPAQPLLAPPAGCQCGTTACQFGMVCNPSASTCNVPIPACPAPSAAVQAFCLCGATLSTAMCRPGQACQLSSPQAQCAEPLPTCSTSALSTTKCSCGTVPQSVSCNAGELCSPVPSPRCLVNKANNCVGLGGLCVNPVYKPVMQANCEATCALTSQPPQQPACVDKEPNCNQWNASGYCQRYPLQYTRATCAKTCGLC